MNRKAAAPSQGDVVWLDHDPRAGREHAGRYPVLVLSPQAYNAAAGLLLCCPITMQIKGYPFEVTLTGIKGLLGVVLADQLGSLDWSARNAERAGRATDDVVADVLAKLRVLLTQP
ncbi:endoribonuclease MazF [Aquincola sp. S2]|uniref:Endoribonuclease MazF n=1 Tax=Pseudaquabacterium terrae TaxID=2732868 RepID=A0ABX2ERU2_9BURK|nr:endoribonuclease MazF [Aquabacterium terrae]